MFMHIRKIISKLIFIKIVKFYYKTHIYSQYSNSIQSVKLREVDERGESTFLYYVIVFFFLLLFILYHIVVISPLYHLR